METTFIVILMICYTILIGKIGIGIGEFLHMNDYDQGCIDTINQINQMNNNNDKENNE